MNENIKKEDRDNPLLLNLVSAGYNSDGEFVYIAKCPNCGRTIDVYSEKQYKYYEEHYNYCPTCGQRLDWSYVDDD